MTIPAGSDHEAAEKTYVVDGKRRTLAEVARQIVEETRAAQGLPFHVEDPATLDRIARIMASTGDD